MERPAPGTSAEEERRPFDYLASFRVLYLALFAFMMLYVVSIEVAETMLQRHFKEQVRIATRVSPSNGPIVVQIHERVDEVIQSSPWVRVGGRPRARDGPRERRRHTPLHRHGPDDSCRAARHHPRRRMYRAVRMLPTDSDVHIAVAHGSMLSASILIAYASVLLSGLFFYNRSIARREAARLAGAVAARESAAQRARSIESELSAVRNRLDELEPSERSQSVEIQKLQGERASLRAKLSELARREAELVAGAERSTELEDERQALEDLLEEALEDVNQKESEINELQDRLKTAAKKKPSGGGSSKSREAERLARRMKTLYKNLAFDDRAIADLVALRDDAMKLRAEEALKRLAEDSESAAVRRKVGGLPPALSIFELGFAGKGRIYYSRNDSGVYRVLSIGAKNTQQKDLEYLSRLEST